MLKIGDKAPDFTLLNQDGKAISLSDFLGKKVIVYFYPKDDTPGCTTQACSFRDSYDDFKELDVVVLGISKDSVESHKKFYEKYNLPFNIISDPNLEAIKAYDVWVEKKMFGKTTMGVSRSTFIVDEKGRIEQVFRKASPDKNAEEILFYLKLDKHTQN